MMEVGLTEGSEIKVVSSHEWAIDISGLGKEEWTRAFVAHQRITLQA